MAFVASKEIPDRERVLISLTRIKGIGLISSKKLLKETGVDENLRVKNLTEEQLRSIRNAIDSSNLVMEAELNRELAFNIRRLQDINCYRGMRHRSKLPVRGQRTKTNSRTRRGKRPPIAGKKQAPRH